MDSLNSKKAYGLRAWPVEALRKEASGLSMLSVAACSSSGLMPPQNITHIVWELGFHLWDNFKAPNLSPGLCFLSCGAVSQRKARSSPVSRGSRGTEGWRTGPPGPSGNTLTCSWEAASLARESRGERGVLPVTLSFTANPKQIKERGETGPLPGSRVEKSILALNGGEKERKSAHMWQWPSTS